MRNKPQIPAVWPTTAQRTGVDLLSRLQNREPEALGELYDRDGRLAYLIILRIVAEQGVAEDLLGETFVTVWNQIARWKEARGEDLRLWVLLLARDHATEYLRSRNEPLPRALPRPSALAQPNVLQELRRAGQTDRGNRLRRAFASLSEREARLLEMASFDGLPASEIASKSGESVAAVKKIVDAAMAKLQGA